MTRGEFIDSWLNASDKNRVMVECLLKIESFWKSNEKDLIIKIHRDISVEYEGNTEDAENKPNN